jgi:polyisoprenoid-binding protein YceI
MFVALTAVALRPPVAGAEQDGSGVFTETHAADSEGDSGAVFVIAARIKQTSIVFHSDAPLESFSGTTSDVNGYLTFDPAHPERGGVGSIVVPVASLKTGIPLRDEHLRGEDWLDATRFPEIRLRVAKVDSVRCVDSAAGSQTYEVTARGALHIHGEVQEVALNATLTYLPESEATRKRVSGDWLAIRARVLVALADFGIGGPARTDIVGSRVGDTVAVDISLLATSQARASKNTDGPRERPSGPD